jgi:hypothetical protein
MSRINARRQGGRQRLREKDPDAKRRRVAEVVEILQLVDPVAEGSKFPAFFIFMMCLEIR